jgi:hypothetical protein
MAIYIISSKVFFRMFKYFFCHVFSTTFANIYIYIYIEAVSFATLQTDILKGKHLMLTEYELGKNKRVFYKPLKNTLI